MRLHLKPLLTYHWKKVCHMTKSIINRTKKYTLATLGQGTTKSHNRCIFSSVVKKLVDPL
jgi:hypothetical protein